MSDPRLSALGVSLTDAFCRGLDRPAIRAALERHPSGGSTGETLAAVWGIEDRALLERLAGLGLDREAIAALALTPLVEVAWADGEVDRKERAAVLEAAGRYGLARGDPSYGLLEIRLGERPGPELLATWKSTLRMLQRTLDAPALRTLRGEVMARARRVAEASGGLLGLGARISKAELAKLDDLEQSFLG